MRILYVTNGFPFPLTSGYLRHFFLLRELASRHSVALLSLVGADFRPEHAQALAGVADPIVPVASPSRSRSVARKAAARLSGITGLGREADPGARLAAAAAELLAAEPFDVAVVSGKRTYRILAALRGLPVVVDMCDATSSRVRGSLRYAPAGRRAVLALEYLAVRRAERLLLARADHAVFASAPSCSPRPADRRRPPVSSRTASTSSTGAARGPRSAATASRSRAQWTIRRTRTRRFTSRATSSRSCGGESRVPGYSSSAETPAPGGAPAGRGRGGGWPG